MAKDFINSKTMPVWKGTFSQVVVVPGARPPKLSTFQGQVSVAREKNLVGEGDLRLQAIQAFQNLQSALSRSGSNNQRYRETEYLRKNHKLRMPLSLAQHWKSIFRKEICRPARGSEWNH